MSKFLSLDTDIWIRILSFLNIQDTLNAGKVCKTFTSLLRTEDQIWELMYRNTFMLQIRGHGSVQLWEQARADRRRSQLSVLSDLSPLEFRQLFLPNMQLIERIPLREGLRQGTFELPETNESGELGAELDAILGTTRDSESLIDPAYAYARQNPALYGGAHLTHPRVPLPSDFPWEQYGVMSREYCARGEESTSEMKETVGNGSLSAVRRMGMGDALSDEVEVMSSPTSSSSSSSLTSFDSSSILKSTSHIQREWPVSMFQGVQSDALSSSSTSSSSSPSASSSSSTWSASLVSPSPPRLSPAASSSFIERARTAHASTQASTMLPFSRYEELLPLPSLSAFPKSASQERNVPLSSSSSSSTFLTAPASPVSRLSLWESISWRARIRARFADLPLRPSCLSRHGLLREAFLLARRLVATVGTLCPVMLRTLHPPMDYQALCRLASETKRRGQMLALSAAATSQHFALQLFCPRQHGPADPAPPFTNTVPTPVTVSHVFTLTPSLSIFGGYNIRTDVAWHVGLQSLETVSSLVSVHTPSTHAAPVSEQGLMVDRHGFHLGLVILQTGQVAVLSSLLGNRRRGNGITRIAESLFTWIRNYLDALEAGYIEPSLPCGLAPSAASSVAAAAALATSSDREGFPFLDDHAFPSALGNHVSVNHSSDVNDKGAEKGDQYVATTSTSTSTSASTASYSPPRATLRPDRHPLQPRSSAKRPHPSPFLSSPPPPQITLHALINRLSERPPIPQHLRAPWLYAVYRHPRPIYPTVSAAEDTHGLLSLPEVARALLHAPQRTLTPPRPPTIARYPVRGFASSDVATCGIRISVGAVYLPQIVRTAHVLYCIRE